MVAVSRLIAQQQTLWMKLVTVMLATPTPISFLIIDNIGGTSNVHSKADIQEVLILASGVLPESTQPRRREFSFVGQECTVNRPLRPAGETGIFDPTKTFRLFD